MVRYLLVVACLLVAGCSDAPTDDVAIEPVENPDPVGNATQNTTLRRVAYPWAFEGTTGLANTGASGTSIEFGIQYREIHELLDEMESFELTFTWDAGSPVHEELRVTIECSMDRNGFDDCPGSTAIDVTDSSPLTIEAPDLFYQPGWFLDMHVSAPNLFDLVDPGQEFSAEGQAVYWVDDDDRRTMG